MSTYRRKPRQDPHQGLVWEYTIEPGYPAMNGYDTILTCHRCHRHFFGMGERACMEWYANHICRTLKADIL